ncbi:MAG: hypothetical protein Unbinned4264contig1000_16 [Prokaryotic dsDNA virus sp.]|nr:MAG: hypothetical protein Unbinned4264contig1000_16 [Prokaryotic dsDNA virus sp.]
MKFICHICGNKKNIYKVKFKYIEIKGLVCEEARCCDTYMEQIKTEEYKGFPDIKRNEEHMSGDRLWNDFKYNNTEK